MAVTSQVTDLGSGPTLIMAHGMELDRHLFAAQQAELSTDFRVIAYDLRARTPAGEQAYKLDDLIADFERLLDELDVGRCLFIGMSMGGFVAIRAALRCPERVAGVVLIGSSAVPYAAELIDQWRPAYEALRGSASVPDHQARADAELHFSDLTRHHRPELVDEWAERIRSRSGTATWHEFASWAWQDDLTPRLASLRVPLLIIHGDEDRAVPLEMALETHARIPGSRLMVLPFAAHAVNLEYPAEVSRAIRTFAEVTLAEELA